MAWFSGFVYFSWSHYGQFLPVITARIDYYSMCFGKRWPETSSVLREVYSVPAVRRHLGWGKRSLASGLQICKPRINEDQFPAVKQFHADKLFITDPQVIAELVRARTNLKLVQLLAD